VDVRRGLLAGAVGGLVGGIPSTVHAVVTGADPLEATYAAGSILLPHERDRARLLAAAALTHGVVSLGWGVALAGILPRRHPVLAGAAAGLVIAALDLGVVGRRLERVRRLPLTPQVADHVVFGFAVGAVAGRHREMRGH